MRKITHEFDFSLGQQRDHEETRAKRKKLVRAKNLNQMKILRSCCQRFDLRLMKEGGAPIIKVLS